MEDINLEEYVNKSGERTYFYQPEFEDVDKSHTETRQTIIHSLWK